MLALSIFHPPFQYAQSEPISQRMRRNGNIHLHLKENLLGDPLEFFSFTEFMGI